MLLILGVQVLGIDMCLSDSSIALNLKTRGYSIKQSKEEYRYVTCFTFFYQKWYILHLLKYYILLSSMDFICLIMKVSLNLGDNNT